VKGGRINPLLAVALIAAVLSSVPLLYLLVIQPGYEVKMSEMNRQLDLAHDEVQMVAMAESKAVAFQAETAAHERRIRAQQHLKTREVQQISLAVRELPGNYGVTLSEQPEPMQDPMWVQWKAEIDADSFDALTNFEADLVSIGGGLSAVDVVRGADGRVRGSFEIAVAVTDPWGVDVRPRWSAGGPPARPSHAKKR
jgi:hypothetical protein